MAPQTIAVIGGLDADLIMIASRIPGPGESVLANEYLEALGGKGANSAIATYRTCHKSPLDKKRTTGDEVPEESTGGDNAASAPTQQPTPATERLTISGSGDEYIQVKMIGAVGDDHYGDKFITELNKNGVDTSGIVTVPNTRSSVCFVIVEDSTRENRCLFTLGATATWKKDDFIHAEQLGGGIRPDLVVAQMEIDKDVVETMIETAGNAGVDFCLNAAPATPIGDRFYKHLTHLLVNEAEAAIMSGRDRDEVDEETWPVIAQEFLDRGVKNVVITLGAKGSFHANAMGSGHCRAFDVQVKDTKGAGDAFTGAYAADYLRQKAKGTWDIESAVVRANKAAAITIQSMGAQDGIPWADEIDQFDAPYKVPEMSPSGSTAGIASGLS
ncbi:Uu.00g017080.m01.CDS01 [Anthostomella pinea]|uniref:Ribokinase n=1 Tax=Anthostomella pinea TaxID=933095 RepID=A0AAI8VZH5_9PEZI|nr:Uu.00g017080.m01.CDS01 [Anthostomella pinea]